MLLSPVRLTLDKGPHTFGGYDGGPVQSPIVSGVEIPGLFKHDYYDYEPAAEPTTREILLPSEMALRLGSFFMQCYTAEPSLPRSERADCHTFVDYMMGLSDQSAPVVQSKAATAPLEEYPTPIEDMQLYTPYGMVKWKGDRGDNIHSVIALPGDESISVRGIGSAVVLADTACMLHEFGAQTVHRIIGPPHY